MQTQFIISVLNRDSALKIEQQLLDARVVKENIFKFERDWRNNTSQCFDVFS